MGRVVLLSLYSLATVVAMVPVFSQSVAGQHKNSGPPPFLPLCLFCFLTRTISGLEAVGAASGAALWSPRLCARCKALTGKCPLDCFTVNATRLGC